MLPDIKIVVTRIALTLVTVAVGAPNGTHPRDFSRRRRRHIPTPEGIKRREH